MSLLGIDVGTTGSKSVVVNNDGQVLASAYIEYPVLSPNTGWFELDPQKVLSACKQVIAKTADQVKDSDPVRGIGISSQGEAFTAIDKDSNYLCNAMVSFDARSQNQVESFVASFGAERLYNITGHSAHTLFSLFKIEWLKENRPEAFSKIYKIMCMGDLLGFELTGSAAISDNLAARTMMFDVSKRKWSQEVLEAVGIKEGALSKVIKADEIIGTVCDSMASELAIGRGVPVAAGGHDQSCGALGVGAAGELRAAYSIGTVECITPAINKCVLNKNMMHSNLATYPHVESGLYTTVAFCTTGGSGLKWFRDNLGKYEIERARQSGEDVYDLLLSEMPVEPSGLMVLPHFCATGTPYFDPSPTGAIIGLKLSTSKGELVKGLLEGITFETKLNLELLRKSGIALNELRAFGGGAKSGKWMQIKADILNLPIASAKVNEAGCFGAAMLAGKAAGLTKSSKELSDNWIKIDRRYEPDNNRVRQYNEKFGYYQNMYETLKAIATGHNKFK